MDLAAAAGVVGVAEDATRHCCQSMGSSMGVPLGSAVRGTPMVCCFTTDDNIGQNVMPFPEADCQFGFASESGAAASGSCRLAGNGGCAAQLVRNPAASSPFDRGARAAYLSLYASFALFSLGPGWARGDYAHSRVGKPEIRSGRLPVRRLSVADHITQGCWAKSCIALCRRSFWRAGLSYHMDASGDSPGATSLGFS